MTPTLWIKLGAAAVVIILIALFGQRRYAAGQAATQKDWDAAIARGQAEIARLQAEAGKITVKTETVYVDRIKTIREKGDEIIRKVPVYVPVGSCDLPGGFRLLHDAAAGNQPLPDPARIADAAPVDAQTVASTVAGNYGTCHETAQRLISLQDWVSGQAKINP
jgi:hypothetical protein